MSLSEDTLREFDLFHDLDPDHLSLLASGGKPLTFAVDEQILTADQPADVIYAIESGRVAIEIDAGSGGPLIIETIGRGDVAGMSWLLPPYRWTFDARAIDDVATIALDAKVLRRNCDEHPVFGYEIYKRFAGLVHQRLIATRLRVIDLYGFDGPRT